MKRRRRKRYRLKTTVQRKNENKRPRAGKKKAEQDGLNVRTLAFGDVKSTDTTAVLRKTLVQQVKTRRLNHLNSLISDDAPKLTASDLAYHDKCKNLSLEEMLEREGMEFVYDGMSDEESKQHFDELLAGVEII